MIGIDFWSVNDELSVVQAALLAVSCDPAKYASVESWDVEDRPDGYEAIATLLKNSIISGKLSAKKKLLTYTTHYDQYSDSEYVPCDELDWCATLVYKQDVVTLLSNKGFKEGFLFRDSEHVPLYLDPSHEFYSLKLHAAIQTWQALQSNLELLLRKTPKQAATIWLKKNAALFGLLKEDGNYNLQAIEEIAKIMNWEVKGGAPKIPALALAANNPNPQILFDSLDSEERAVLENDEIPY